MARQPRYTVPGQPQHVIQRGNNRTRMFGGPTDFLFFRECFLSSATEFECAIHAFVLMSNHVHLLVSPKSAFGISKMIQSIGRRYVPYFNERNERTGALWEGRYRATIIDSARYLFTCSRYIEENPVRAGMVVDPSHYPWSSYRTNALGMEDELVTPHDLYQSLGQSASSRQLAYRDMFSSSADPAVFDVIRRATNHGWALGDDRFRQAISRLGRRAAPMPPGPPSVHQVASRRNKEIGV